MGKKDENEEKYEAIGRAWKIDTKPNRLAHNSKLSKIRRFLKLLKT